MQLLINSEAILSAILIKSCFEYIFIKYDLIFSYSEAMAILKLKYNSKETKVMLNCFLLHLEQSRIAKMVSFRYFGQLEQPQCQRMAEHLT